MTQQLHLDDATTARVLADLGRISDVPARLRAVARFRGATLAHLARETGISYVRIERVLNRRIAPRQMELDAIARALDVRVDDEAAP